MYNSLINNGILTEIETKELLEKYGLGDSKAKEELIIRNIPLVKYHVCNKFGRTEFDIEDLIQIGILGLISAVETYKIDKNIKFHTYASICICNRVLNFLKTKKNKLNAASLDEIIKENGKSITLIENIMDKEIDIQMDYEKKEILLAISYYVENLEERNKEIMKLYYGFYDKCYNQKEIASIYNISRQRISSILERELIKLKKYLLNKELLDYDELKRRVVL